MAHPRLLSPTEGKSKKDDTSTIDMLRSSDPFDPFAVHQVVSALQPDPGRRIRRPATAGGRPTIPKPQACTGRQPQPTERDRLTGRSAHSEDKMPGKADGIAV